MVHANELLPFGRDEACRPRKRDNYRRPLLLAKQAPGPQRQKSWALVSLVDVAFNQAFTATRLLEERMVKNSFVTFSCSHTPSENSLRSLHEGPVRSGASGVG